MLEKIKPVSAKTREHVAVAPTKHCGLEPEGVGEAAVVPKVTVDGVITDRIAVVLPVKVMGLLAQPEAGASVTVVVPPVYSVVQAASAHAFTVTMEGVQVSPEPVCSRRIWFKAVDALSAREMATQAALTEAVEVRVPVAPIVGRNS